MFAKNLLESIIQNVDNGITVQDKDGKLVFANEIASKMIGSNSAKELIKTPISQVLSRFAVMVEKGNISSSN